MVTMALIGLMAVPQVVSETARWSEDGRWIVTEAVVRGEDGGLRTEVWRGGCVGRVCARVMAVAGDHAAVQTHSARGTPLRWPSAEVRLTPGPAPGDAELRALEAAVGKWQAGIAACSGLAIGLEAPLYVEAGRDEVNAIVWGGGDWAYAPEASAVTTLWFIDEPGSADDGHVIEADVELNPAHFAWADAGECAMDTGNTLAHEIGHVLGLDHVCDAGDGALDLAGNPVPACSEALPAPLTGATMYPYQGCDETNKRTPEAIDIGGVCAIYPDDSELVDEEEYYCGGSPATACCAIAPDGSPRGLAPLALALLGLAITRRRRGAARRRATAPR